MTENINTAIMAVMAEVGYVKKTKTGGLKYSYAGEAALIEALRPVMVTNGISVGVSGIEIIDRSEYATKSGTLMHSITMISDITFTHAASGTSKTVKAVGEGSDAGDKAAYKAQTGAYKYGIRQTFCIETGDDPDKYSSDDQEKAPAKKASKPAKTPAKQSARTWPTDVISAVKEAGAYEAAKHVVAILNLSTMPGDVGADMAVRWEKCYRGQRDNGAEKDPAAEAANAAYLKATK